MDPEQVLMSVDANTTTSPNKRVMTLYDAQQELERQGMSCNFVDDHLLVGVMSKCRWELTAKIDTLVFVQYVPGQLTLDRLFADLEDLPSRVEQNLVGAGDCPPFGAARGHLVMLVYYAETIQQEVVYEIVQRAQNRQWCCTTFLAAQDAQGQSYYLAENKTPFWGRAFFPELRYRAQLLTGYPVDELEQPPGIPLWVKVVNILLIPYLIFAFISSPITLYIFLGFLLVMFLVAFIFGWFRRRSYKKEGRL